MQVVAAGRSRVVELLHFSAAAGAARDGATPFGEPAAAAVMPRSCMKSGLFAFSQQ